MARKHVLIFPSGNGVDFYRAERSYDGVWLRSSVASWITVLLPAVLQSVEAADFTFSSFRELPCGDPSLMPLPSGSGYAVKIFAPCGGFFPDQFGSILFHSESHPPAVAGDRFIPTNGGIRRQVEQFFSADFIDLLRKPDKPRIEFWLRHGGHGHGNGSGITIEDMLPGAYDAPRWLRETSGLTPEEAAAKLNELRAPNSAAEYYRSRAAARAEAERLKAAQDDPGQPESAARATVEAEAVSPETAATEPATPAVMSMSEKAEKRRIRDRLRRSTRSKVAADKANAELADAWAAKRVRELERSGAL